MKIRRFSANLVVTNSGNPIKNGVIGVDESGQVVEIIDHSQGFREYAHTEFRNGIIVPGFINAHVHTELSSLKGKVEQGLGLSGFVRRIREQRILGEAYDEASIVQGIREMQQIGTVAAADICNTASSFQPKENSSIRFVNLIEVLGLEQEFAAKIFEKAQEIADLSVNQFATQAYITPHSTYSLSEALWEQFSRYSSDSPILSVHLAESDEENDFLINKKGGIYENYESWGLPTNSVAKGSSLDIAMRFISENSKVLFVHNTVMDEPMLISLLRKFKDSSFVFCPASNLYIEGKLPNIPMFVDNGAHIALGSDSLASSPTLSVFDQVMLVLEHFPKLDFLEVLKWATINGAIALGLAKEIGSIEYGKSPGLNLIAPFNFLEMRPYPHSKVTRLV